MDYIKKTLWGPTPEEQMRKCNQLMRKNKRELERSINGLTPLNKKTETLIKGAVKKGDMKNAKLYARELVMIQNQKKKLHTSKAQLESVNMQINEQFQMKKMAHSMKDSTFIMREVNQLVKLPQISMTMQELSKELMKSGIINEMINDTVELNNEFDDELEEESEEEVSKILSKYTDEKFNKMNNLPTTELEVPEAKEEENEENEQALDDFRQRLRALQG